MLPREKKALLKRKKRYGYIPYPIFFIILWFSPSYVFNIIIITVAVIYIISHQGYYFYQNEKLDNVEVGF